MPRLARFATFCLALLVTQLLAAQATFSSQATYQTGANPQSVVSDDFNKDGNKDVAIAIYDDQVVEVHYGTSTGTFDQAGTQIPALGFPKKVMVADMNKDGYPDVVVLEDASSKPNAPCSGKPMFEIFYGGATGLRPPDAFCIPDSKPFYVDMAVADIDGNGWLDVALLAPDKTLDVVLFRAPDSPDNFTFIRSTVSLTDVVAQALAITDINGDGKPDLVVSACCANGDNSHGHVSYLPGNGDGTFGSATEIASHQATSLISADINDDGRRDIVATLQDCVPNAGCDSAVAWFPNISGTLGHANIVWESFEGAYMSPRSPVVGDFTGDGHDDIAFLVTDQKFQVGSDFLFVTDIANSATAKIELGYNLGARSIAWTNISGSSSLPDLVSVNDVPSTFTVLLNTTDSTGGANCNAPDTVSVSICMPVANSTTSSNNVRLQAAASVLKRAYRFEVWEASTKLFTGRESDSIDTSLNFANGTHKLEFVAYNSDNSSRATSNVTFTVGAPLQCPPPGANNGVHVCSPQTGATIPNPVPILAGARVTGSIYRFELWVDEVKMFTVRNGNTMNTSLSLPSGKHTFVFTAYNANKSSHVSTTVTTTVP